ncbi:MAG: hypothetical protein Q3983_01000 [Capnocytophaga sp.]|nr:hypothetical protein [Capnocytophaga sp.]
MGLSCSLQTLKDIYEDQEDREAIPQGVAVFANPYASDFLYIEQASGTIYREDYDEEGKPCLGEKLWNSIEEFLAEAKNE